MLKQKKKILQIRMLLNMKEKVVQSLEPRLHSPNL